MWEITGGSGWGEVWAGLEGDGVGSFCCQLNMLMLKRVWFLLVWGVRDGVGGEGLEMMMREGGRFTAM